MGRRWERMVENPLKTAKKRVSEGFNCAIPTLASSAYFLRKLAGLKTESQSGVTEAADTDGEDHFPQPCFTLERCWSTRSTASPRSRNQSGRLVGLGLAIMGGTRFLGLGVLM
jgi:hypothetical protein